MDISYTKERITGKFCVLWSENYLDCIGKEINSKVESSFSLNMTKKNKTKQNKTKKKKPKKKKH